MFLTFARTVSSSRAKVEQSFYTGFVPNVYLFDLDGTLVDRLPSLKAFLPEQYLRYSTHKVSQTDDYVARFLNLDGGGYASKHEVYKTLVREFGLSVSVSELVDDLRTNAFKACAAQSDALAVLERLRLRGVKLGVVTNGSIAAQEQKLKAAGLTPYLEVCLISEAVGTRKPDPAIFKEAARRFEAEPSACVFIGDHPEKDIVGAQKVGMHTVWLGHGRTWPEQLDSPPTFEISSLEELLALSFAR